MQESEPRKESCQDSKSLLLLILIYPKELKTCGFFTTGGAAALALQGMGTSVFTLCPPLLIKENILDRNPVNVVSVVKPFYVPVIYKDIKGCILKRNFMIVINVVRVFHVIIVSDIIKEHTLERNVINAINVVKPICNVEVYKDIKEHILERHLVNTIMN